MTISNEAVEAAARVMLDKMYDDKTLKVDDEDRDITRAALEAAAPILRAETLEAAADDWRQRSDTFLKTMEHMAASREYGADDILRYGAYSAEANTSAHKLRARAAAERGRQ